MADPRRLRVFLCHAHGDKPAVRDLYRRLQADGVQPWLDEEDVAPGQRWRDEIPRAVRQSDVVLVCLLQKSINKEGFVQREIKVALDAAEEQPEGAIFIIPARLEEVDAPERLAEYHWVNLFDERGYTRLLRALTIRAAALGIDVQPELPKLAPSPFTLSVATLPTKSLEPDASQHVTELFAQLKQVEKQFDWDEVIQIGEAILTIDPDNLMAQRKTGQAYNQRGKNSHAAAYAGKPDGDYTKAITDQTRAIHLVPGKAEYYYERGKSYHNAAYDGHVSGDFARAIADYTRAIEIAPNKADYYLERGRSYHTAAYYDHPSGDYAEAIADKTRAIEIAPNKADYYLERGRSYHTAAYHDHPSGDYAKAIADHTKAIELAPNKADAYWERGKSYHNAAYDGRLNSDYAKAIADYGQAIELDPTKADYYNLRGQSYHQAANEGKPGGDYAKAIADKTRAIELDPTKADYYYSRGLSYKLKGDRVAARRDFQEAADRGHEEAKKELAGM